MHVGTSTDTSYTMFQSTSRSQSGDDICVLSMLNRPVVGAVVCFALSPPQVMLIRCSVLSDWLPDELMGAERGLRGVEKYFRDRSGNPLSTNKVRLGRAAQRSLADDTRTSSAGAAEMRPYYERLHDERPVGPSHHQHLPTPHAAKP